MKQNKIQAPFWWRLGTAILLIFSAVLLSRIVTEHAVNPLAGIAILEPLVGLMLFWPLSRVLIRSTSLVLGLGLSLLPTLTLIAIRFSGSEANLSFGAMIFFGIAGLAAYLLFRSLPKEQKRIGL